VTGSGGTWFVASMSWISAWSTISTGLAGEVAGNPVTDATIRIGTRTLSSENGTIEPMRTWLRDR